MQASDFIYDNISLSSLGYTVCNFGTDSSIDTVTTDSQRSFQNVSMLYGKYLPMTVSVYADRLEMTFSICKNPEFTNPDMSVEEVRFMKRWLNRPTYHKFKIVHEGFSGIYFEGSFNIEEQRFAGYVNGLELTFITNRPFALHEPIFYESDLNGQSDTLSVVDISDEIGWIYPDITITCSSSGDLNLRNSFDGRETIIKNCTEGEVITFTPNLILQSSNESHPIQDDFNYTFLRISNSLHQRRNQITSTLPCHIHISYSPIVKAVI